MYFFLCSYVMFWLAAAGQLTPRAAEPSIHAHGEGGVTSGFCRLFCFFSAFLPIAFLVLPLMSLGNANCYPPWQFWRPWLGQMYHIFSVRAEHTQAAAALRSRLLAPSISTPAAAGSPGDTRPWNAFSKYDHFKHEIFIRSQAAASI